jgi:hypothetical protein
MIVTKGGGVKLKVMITANLINYTLQVPCGKTLDCQYFFKLFFNLPLTLFLLKAHVTCEKCTWYKIIIMIF